MNAPPAPLEDKFHLSNAQACNTPPRPTSTSQAWHKKRERERRQRPSEKPKASAAFFCDVVTTHESGARPVVASAGAFISEGLQKHQIRPTQANVSEDCQRHHISQTLASERVAAQKANASAAETATEATSIQLLWIRTSGIGYAVGDTR